MTPEEEDRKQAVLKYLSGKKFYALASALSTEYEIKYFEKYEKEMMEEKHVTK